MSISPYRFFIKASFFSLSLGFLSPVFAANGPIGVVLASSGKVQATNSQSQTRSLARGGSLYVGDEIKTGPDSSVDLRFSDKGLVSLKANSDYKVNQYSYKGTEDKSPSMSATIVKGKMMAITGAIAKKSPQKYLVQSKLTAIAVSGTQFSTEVRNNFQTLVVYHGTVIFSSKRCAVTVGDRGMYRAAIITSSSLIPIGFKTTPSWINSISTIR